MSYRPGDRLGDYEIVDVLGAGGMGRVYKVRNLITERIEAMKVLLPNLEQDPDLTDRFQREIKVQASLEHPNIAGLHSALRINNQLLMLIEYVEGSTVEAMLRKQSPLSVSQALGCVQQILLGLSYAHQQGVVHRDIKPGNIIVSPDGTAKLMDFGIARVSADPGLTQTGRTVGSLYYMSPEQIQGAPNLDGRSDLYSLGVTLYEMVTARRPFQGDSDYSIMAAHLNARPMPPVEIDPTLPQALSDVILTAIAKDPARRFQTADAFRSALNSVLSAKAEDSPRPVPSPVSAPPAAVPVDHAPPKSRRGLYVAAGSLATVAVIALAATQASHLFTRSSAASQIASQAPSVSPPPQSPSAAAIQEQTPPVPPPEKPAPKRSPISPQPAVQPPPAVSSTTPAPAPAERDEAAGQPAPAPVSPPAPVQQDVTPQRELLVLLATRANSVRSSLASIRQQQAAQGLNLRQDIATAEQRMEFYLDEAQAALKARDAEGAKKNLASAEKAIETIEQFFGR